MTATKLDLVKVEDWGLFTDTTKPIIIADLAVRRVNNKFLKQPKV